MKIYEILSSELSANCLLSERIVYLGKNTVDNAQYNRCESLGINPVLTSINDEVLESNICKAPYPTDYEVKLNDLQAFHHLKKKDTVIVRFKCEK